MPRRWISARKLAERRETSVSNIYRLARIGQLPPPVKLAPNCTRFDLDEIERLEAEAIEAARARHATGGNCAEHRAKHPALYEPKAAAR